jgi:hypothetical protein
MHYKTDLLTDEQLAAYTVQTGDILTLNLPGTDKSSRERVESREDSDAGKHPVTGEHLTRVTLLLNTV